MESQGRPELVAAPARRVVDGRTPRVDGISNTVHHLGACKPSDPFCAVQIGTISTLKTQERRPRESGAAAGSPVAPDKQRRLAHFAGDGSQRRVRGSSTSVRASGDTRPTAARRAHWTPVVIRSCCNCNWRSRLQERPQSPNSPRHQRRAWPERVAAAALLRGVWSSMSGSELRRRRV